MTTSDRVIFHSVDDYGGHGTMEWLLERRAGMVRSESPYDADIVVFNGGADISPSIYGELPVATSAPTHPSRRDREEMKLFDDLIGVSVKPPKLLLGICRGAQLLNCLNGGSLWQDVNNHDRTHDLYDLKTKKIYKTTSTHHQMMIPAELGEIIAVSSESSYKQSQKGCFDFDPWSPSIADGKDLEIIWYPKSSSLCIQGHPEYVPNSEFADYCIGLMYYYLNEVQQACAA